MFYNTLSHEIPIKKIIGVDIFIPPKLEKFLKKKCGKKLELIKEQLIPSIIRCYEEDY